MNRELISKLYTQAVDHCVEQGPNSDGTNKAWLWEEKFAELIINECISTFASYDLHGAEDPIADIRTQFGVN